MVRGQRISPELAKTVHALYTQVKSYDKVSRHFGHTKGWARTVVQNFDATTGEPLKQVPRGARRKTTSDQDEEIVRFINNNPDFSIKQGTVELKEQGIIPENVSYATLARRIKDLEGSRTGKAKSRTKKTIDGKGMEAEVAEEIEVEAVDHPDASSKVVSQLRTDLQIEIYRVVEVLRADFQAQLDRMEEELKGIRSAVAKILSDGEDRYL